MKHVFEFGTKVEDVITGFSGRIHAIVYYQTGCDQALVLPKGKKNTRGTGEWFDVSRLKVIDTKDPVKLIDHDGSGRSPVGGPSTEIMPAGM